MPVIYVGSNLKLYEGSFGMHKAPHQIRYKADNGKEVRQIVPKGEDALSWAKAMDEQLDKVSHLNEGGFLYRDLVELYISDLQQQVKNYREDSKYGQRLAPSTFKKNMVHLQTHAIPYFGGFDVRQITPSKVIQFQRHLQKSNKPQYVNQIIGTLSRSISHLVVLEYLNANPCREVRGLSEEQAEQGYTPSSSEVMRVIQMSSEPREKIQRDGSIELLDTPQWHKSLIWLCAETGIRISEALALRWTDIRMDRVMITKGAVRKEVGRGKTRESVRPVRLSAECAGYFSDLRMRSNPADFVFKNSNGRLFTNTDVQRQVLHPACDHAMVPRFGWNGLRRAYTQAMVKKHDKDTVRKKLGHSRGSRVLDKHYYNIDAEDIMGDDYIVDYGLSG